MAKRIGEFEQLLLLALLRLGDKAHGMTLRREIQVRTGRTVSAGAVYTAMERLEARGLVSSEIGEPTPRRGGKARKFYEIEERGAQAVASSYQVLSAMAEDLGPILSRIAAEDLESEEG